MTEVEEALNQGSNKHCQIARSFIFARPSSTLFLLREHMFAIIRPLLNLILIKISRDARKTLYIFLQHNVDDNKCAIQHREGNDLSKIPAVSPDVPSFILIFNNNVADCSMWTVQQ